MRGCRVSYDASVCLGGRLRRTCMPGSWPLGAVVCLIAAISLASAQNLTVTRCLSTPCSNVLQVSVAVSASSSTTISAGTSGLILSSAV